jgi:multidrug efflux pump subunit AcrA (membrane-fusion protein)
VSNKSAIAKIVDLPALMVRSDVLPADAPSVKRGTKVAIIFGDYPDRKFDGNVQKVDALPADQQGKVYYEATINFDNTGGMVKPNSTVRAVGVVVGHHYGVVAVPLDAVGKDPSGKPFVKVMKNDNWGQEVVELGMSDGNFVEIKSGVHDGDSVQVVPGQGQWLIGTNLTTSS